MNFFETVSEINKETTPITPEMPEYITQQLKSIQLAKKNANRFGANCLLQTAIVDTNMGIRFHPILFFSENVLNLVGLYINAEKEFTDLEDFFYSVTTSASGKNFVELFTTYGELSTFAIYMDYLSEHNIEGEIERINIAVENGKSAYAGFMDYLKEKELEILSKLKENKINPMKHDTLYNVME